MPDQSSSAQHNLERFRSYVAFLARWHWNPRLQPKLDPSDVIQNTLLNALNGLPTFRGQSDLEMRVWLRQILLRELSDQARNFDRVKRDISREQSLETSVSDSAVRLEAWLANPECSPSDQAVRNEQIVLLAEAVAALPEAQQTAVTLHHLHGLTIEEISAIMERTPAAVGGLLKRSVAALRKQFHLGESGDH